VVREWFVGRLSEQIEKENKEIQKAYKK